ncbi:MAG: ATP-binding protein [Candidatus Sigynarchaeota archaeon]
MTTNNVIPFPGTVPVAQSGGGNGTAASGGGGSGSGSVSDPHIWMRQQVWAIRYHRRFNEDQKRRILHNFITTQENRKTIGGAFLRTSDRRAYLLDGQCCRLYRIDERDPDFCGYLLSVYGLNSSEPITRHLITSLKNGTIANGLPRQVRRFSYWDRDTQTLYISRYDGTCYVLDGDEVIIRPNGYGPAVFLDDDGGSNCDRDCPATIDYPPGPTVGCHNELFRYLIDDLNYVPASAGGMSPEIQKTCLGIWMFAIAFPDLMPTKPILLVEGDPGSGKTTALQRIARVLHGKDTPLTIPAREDPDFGVKILRSPIAILDDVNKHIEWLQDTLCTYATGGAWARRKLFTDDSEHVIKPQSFLGITTNNPTTFRQGQLADRCLIIRLERRVGDFGATDQLAEFVRSKRPTLQGEWLYWLNEIVRELRQPQPVVTSPYRMADFARLAHLIGRVLDRPNGPPGNWSPEAIDEMLGALQAERDALIVEEGDQLVDLIDKWLDIESNQGRDVRIADLHRELHAIARANGNVTAFFKTARGLAARLRETGGALGNHFEVSRKTGPGGVMLYTFRRT